MPDILAIDPGERVGWAHGRIVGDQLVVIDHGIEPLKQFALFMARPRHDDGVWPEPWALQYYDTVVYERWRLNAAVAQALIGNDMQTSQLIGMIRLLGWLHNVKLVSQDPKDQVIGERCAPHSVTAILDTLPKAHDESHDGSALKHLAYYWYRNYFDPTTTEAQ